MSYRDLQKVIGQEIGKISIILVLIITLLFDLWFYAGWPQINLSTSDVDRLIRVVWGAEEQIFNATSTNEADETTEGFQTKEEIASDEFTSDLPSPKQLSIETLLDIFGSFFNALFNTLFGDDNSPEEKEIFFIDPKTSFSSEEEPEFILPPVDEIDSQGLLDEIRELFFQPEIQIKETILIGPDDQEIRPELIINQEDRRYKIKIKMLENFLPGRYFFEIKFELADKIYKTQTEFDWERIIVFNPVLAPDFENSMIKQDVQDGSIRAVIIEKGGMLELWYAASADDPEAIEWIYLIGDSSIDFNSPLAIRSGTLFWVDKNKQTIFGYAIDEQSLFGNPINNGNEDQKEPHYLEFQVKDEGLWRVVFDAIENRFHFERVTSL